MIVGVLAIQGAFIEHVQVFQSLGVEAQEIRTAQQLAVVDALVIPGGESTTFQLTIGDKLLQAIHEFADRQKPIWGLCAGLIFLSQRGLLACQVERNFYGTHVNSFVRKIPYPEEVLNSVVREDKEPQEFSAIFIRAPVVSEVGVGVRVLQKLNDQIVAVQSDRILGVTFHPELSSSTVWHRYFIEIFDKDHYLTDSI